MEHQPPRSNRRTVLKGIALGTAACMAGDLRAAVPAAAASRSRRGTGGGAPGGLPRATPEALGVAPEAILAFVEAVDEKVGGLHSFMLLRHGQVAAEAWWAPYAASYPHMLFSLSKSFASTAVGLAVSEGHLTVDAAVTSFFPGDLPEKVGDHLAAMRVRHLLTMSTGHDKDATGPTTAAPDGNWVKAFLALPVEHEPGTHFVYNSAATYLLSAIVQELTDKTVLDYLTPRLFGPLGVEGATWETSPQGINTGGWGLSIKTEDIARFGQLYLRKGEWHAKQVVPASWVDEATRKQVSNGTGDASDWTQGYGYQFWRCRHGAFRGDGAFGQFCVVMPEQDAVLAVTSGVGDMQAVLTATWDLLLPGIQPQPLSTSAASEGLRRKLASLSVPPPSGKPTSPTAERISGKTYRFEPNDQKVRSLTLAFQPDRCVVTLQDDRGEHRTECGAAEWLKGTAPLEDRRDGKTAARGAWTADDTYEVKSCFIETPFVGTMICRFEGDQLTLRMKRNVSFGPTERPALVGREG